MQLLREKKNETAFFFSNMNNKLGSNSLKIVAYTTRKAKSTRFEAEKQNTKKNNLPSKAKQAHIVLHKIITIPQIVERLFLMGE